MIVPQKKNVKYSVDEQEGKLTVTAAAIKAVVDKKDGRIEFYNAAGKLLASEAQQGKTFKPFFVPEREIGCDVAKVKDEQRHGLSWRLLFDEVGDALYGLGQHQSEELNMLGKNEDLFQYNTKVSVPFVV